MITKALHYRLTLLATVVLFLIIALGCKKDENHELATMGSISVSEVTSGSAVISGNIVHDGGAKISERGVVWNILPNPTVDGNEGKMSAGSGTGKYSLTLTHLSPGTKYYVCGYATNKAGTAYCEQIEFTTEAALAQLVTMAATEITSEGGIIGVNVTYGGTCPVTARGIVWSTSPQPTVDANEGKTTDGEGTGVFTRELKNLKPNLIYYVRAYVINCAGTSYGNQIHFTTLGWIKDIDNNQYNIVSIGNQVWMAENLKTTRNNDGTAIIYRVGTWTTNYKDIYGLLYNQSTASNRKLCPVGWHVPTKAEFEGLISSVGGKSKGGKLKQTGTAHWISPNTGATNETGFTARGAGRNINQTYEWYRARGYWGSSTSGWALMLDYSNSNVIFSYDDPFYYQSIRCLRNN
jgi:uncharacterized protein (TIGR02145 family)